MEYNTYTPTSALFEEVAKATGIPIEHKMLISGKQYLRPDIQLDKFNLKNGCTLPLRGRISSWR